MYNSTLISVCCLYLEIKIREQSLKKKNSRILLIFIIQNLKEY